MFVIFLPDKNIKNPPEIGFWGRLDLQQIQMNLFEFQNFEKPSLSAQILNNLNLCQLLCPRCKSVQK